MIASVAASDPGIASIQLGSDSSRASAYRTHAAAAITMSYNAIGSAITTVRMRDDPRCASRVAITACAAITVAVTGQIHVTASSARPYRIDVVAIVTISAGATSSPPNALR